VLFSLLLLIPAGGGFLGLRFQVDRFVSLRALGKIGNVPGISLAIAIGTSGRTLTRYFGGAALAAATTLSK
jgi:hypothetical protein